MWLGYSLMPRPLRVFLIIILIGIALFAVSCIPPNPTPTAFGPSDQTPATPTVHLRTKMPIATNIPMTPSVTPTVTPLSPGFTSTPGIGSTRAGVDGMTLLYVPEGEFTMGSSNGNSNEKPAHQVYLDAFWIDKTEVTFDMYSLCIESGDCEKPAAVSYSHNDLPMDSVTWYQANAYCTWAGRRLPTEAEWEKAARGTDQRIYPWGNYEPNSNVLNMNQYGPASVGGFLEGASPFYALDMAGNVWEWVNDWYDEIYYRNSPRANPEGSTAGVSKVIRGGSWDFSADSKLVRTTTRARHDPSTAWFRLGFRCAIDVSP